MLNTKKAGLRGDMNSTDVIMLISINGVHLKLLRMGPVNMATWRSCNTFRTATYKQNVLLRTGHSVNPVCSEHNFVTQTTRVFLQTKLNIRQCTNFAKSRIHLENQDTKMVTEEVMSWGRGAHKYYAPPYKLQITTMIRRPGFIQPFSSLW